MDNIDVSIIIVNYKTPGLVVDAVDSIVEKTTGINYEVIVVDNGSDDGSQRLLTERYADKIRFRYLALDENVGFGRANNAGAKVAVGRNIFCLNPDTRLLNNAVKILSDYLDAHPECGICGGNLYNAEMKPALSFRRILPGVAWEINAMLLRVVDRTCYPGNYFFNNSGKALNVAYVTGADLMISRSLFGEIGGFAPEYFMYFEDTDLCAQVRRRGLKVVSVPEAEIMHLDGGSFESRRPSERKLEMLEQSRRLFYKRNRSTWHARMADGIYSLFLLSRKWLVDKELFGSIIKIRRKL